MTTTAPPTTGLAKHLAFLAQHADVLAEHDEHITSVDVSAYSVSILVSNEGTALDLATTLGTTSIVSAPEPATHPVHTGYEGFIRHATIDGIDVRIASCWHTTKAAA